MNGTKDPSEKAHGLSGVEPVCGPPPQPACPKRRLELDTLLRIFESGAGGPALPERGLHDVLLLALPGRGLRQRGLLPSSLCLSVTSSGACTVTPGTFSSSSWGFTWQALSSQRPIRLPDRWFGSRECSSSWSYRPSSSRAICCPGTRRATGRPRCATASSHRCPWWVISPCACCREDLVRESWRLPDSTFSTRCSCPVLLLLLIAVHFHFLAHRGLSEPLRESKGRGSMPFIPDMITRWLHPVRRRCGCPGSDGRGTGLPRWKARRIPRTPPMCPSRSGGFYF